MSTLNDKPLKLADQFKYLGRNISSTECDIRKRIIKVWTATDSLSIIWKSDISDKIKQQFFQSLILSVQMYGYTTRTLMKRLQKSKMETIQ